MNYSQAANIYSQTKVRTSGRGQLIVMLYEEAVKQMGIAQEIMESPENREPGNIEKTNKAILKTQEIITELMASLDFEKGGEIAQNLYSLYTFFNKELMTANIEKNVEKIKSVKTFMEQLHSAWKEIAKTTVVPEQPVRGLNIIG